ncbi:MAG: elongation factor G [Acidobacteriota bacterium]
MISDIGRIRNIGISAHIDSGKTTLTERILFYTKRIHAIHEVKGKDQVGATMDHMELERERGITITSAATYAYWLDHHINIIDTPGHVDFTIEVERSLRVLDGAILVLCSVAGVQSQSITVDRQMRRYSVPRLAFVNKCDRSGANPDRVVQQLREKLGLNAVALQMPIGLEAAHEGVVDLVNMKAYYFEGDNGENIREGEIPAALRDDAESRRQQMLDAVSMFSDELMEQILEESVQEETVHAAIRNGVIALKLVPVLMGSAYKNKGVQRLLDGVIRYLPSPMDRKYTALDLDKDNAPVTLSSDPDAQTSALAFKLDEGRYGQLTFVRVYQGKLQKGEFVTNSRNQRRVKIGRLVKIHADSMEDIQDAGAGDICGLFGIDCNTGDTFIGEGDRIAMTSIHVPDPVISLSLKTADNSQMAKVSKALQRFTKEDPTFRVHVDDESAETIISGMGELHLDVYVERMKREYGAEVTTGAPQVAYRETITRKSEFNYLHKKQTGGSGQYARVAGFVEPHPDGVQYEFVNATYGGTIPSEYISACDKGFKWGMQKGSLIGSPLVNVRATINDGAAHAVDSSDIAFQVAARQGFKEAVRKAGPVILEPVMKVVVEGPGEFQGSVFKTLMQRRGTIIGSTEEDGFCRIESEVPLAEMFGYSTDLRSNTQGKAEFTMEFHRYAPVPREVQEKMIAEFKGTVQEEDDDK